MADGGAVPIVPDTSCAKSRPLESGRLSPTANTRGARFGDLGQSASAAVPPVRTDAPANWSRPALMSRSRGIRLDQQHLDSGERRRAEVAAPAASARAAA